MSTKELIEKLTKLDPEGKYNIHIYVDQSNGFVFNLEDPWLHIPDEDEEGDPNITISTGTIISY